MEKESSLWKRIGQYRWALLAAALGAVLLVWSGGGEAPVVSEVVPEADIGQTEEALEREMEEILQSIQGVGRTKVMLTLQSGSELVLAQDQSLRYSGATQAPDDYDRAAETVVITDSGDESVVITQERCPQYRGALVVCEGGGSDAVRLQVAAAVSALTGLGTDRIAVMKWDGRDTGTVKGTES